MIATWKAADALKSLFEARYGDFGPTCRRAVKLQPGEQLASQAAIQKARSLCAAAHEQGRAPRIKGGRSTSWARVYAALCAKLMAHTLSDGSALLWKERVFREGLVYHWQSARVVLLHNCRIAFRENESIERLEAEAIARQKDA